ncbi:flagellar biosynthesis protein FlhF [Natronospirillum operosum]|uniref:Flagellar biosynthesis protein FlhF n=1 Tax=Natronospirillum operosum TaxID=2759953 RepID=A0A4Z0WKJ5_9GAMM|nr:flagellar biosynthesis protein FlhF [Natronospirillum operosum]TGG95961.1 flagellar biosynthesis protein FlhF [Natronospirillum operosum]
MKVRKIIARNMSEGLKAVTAEMGPDAMILSNRKVPRGIEIVAAVKPNTDGVPEPARPRPGVRTAQNGLPAPDQTANAPVSDWTGGDARARLQAERKGTTESMQDSILRMSEQDSGGLSRESLLSLLNEHRHPLEEKRQKLREQLNRQQPGIGAAAPTRPAAPQPTRRSTPSPEPYRPEPQNSGAAEFGQHDLSDMRAELASLRQWLETHDLPGESGARPHPLAGRLSLMGFDLRCISPMVEKYGQQPVAEAWTLSTEMVARLIEKDSDCLIRQGGVAALIGPTGAGKTTTLSKIATRFAMQHGADSLGIISLDHYRIGAHEPVRILGRILGCDVLMTDHNEALEDQLARLRDKKLILIDTNGSDRGLQAFRDQMGGGMLERQVRPLLVLPANLSRHSLDLAWQRFSPLQPRGLVLTKADESPEVGPVISLGLIRKLPLLYWSDGTLVPQDLHQGQVKRLIEQCGRQLQRSQSGEKLVRFG